MSVCVSHLYPPPGVRGKFFDGVSDEQHGSQLPESGAPPQFSGQLLIGQLHADRQVTGDQSEDSNGRAPQEVHCVDCSACSRKQHVGLTV